MSNMIVNNALNRVTTVQDAQNGQGTRSEKADASLFREMLEQAEKADLHFSTHAVERMERRNIALTNEELDLLAGGVNMAEKKGAREALLLMEQQKAFVVNVPGRKVITVMDQEGMREKMFTNIDSAILLSKK